MLFDELKTTIRSASGIPPWAILLAAGFVSHLLFNWFLGKPWTSGWGLLPALMLGCGIEAYEIWQTYGLQAHPFAKDVSFGTILARHSIDIVLVTAAPAAAVVFGILIGKQ